MSRMISAADLMSKPVRRLVADTPVRDAVEFLLRHGISGAPVVDDHGNWLGVFTMNDIARHVQNRLLHLPEIDRHRERAKETGEPIPDEKGFHFEGFEDTKVGDLMTPGLITVFPEANLGEIARRMISQKIHRVFVITEDGSIEGIITSMDVLKWVDKKAREAICAKREPATVLEEV